MVFPSDEHSTSASAGTGIDSGFSPAERNQPRVAPRVPRRASSPVPQNTADSASESSPALRRRRSSLPVFKETSRTPPLKAVNNIQSASAEITTRQRFIDSQRCSLFLNKKQKAQAKRSLQPFVDHGLIVAVRFREV